MKNIYTIFFIIILAITSYSQQAPGIVLDGSVNNSTIDTCGVDFFDSGGHEEHC